MIVNVKYRVTINMSIYPENWMKGRNDTPNQTIQIIVIHKI